MIEMKRCPRCSGKGEGPWRPVMGRCYSCGGRGEYPTDKFLREIGLEGDFYGMSLAYPHGLFISKSIFRLTKAELDDRMEFAGSGSSKHAKITPITEAQARAFHSRYRGLHTNIPGPNALPTTKPQKG